MNAKRYRRAVLELLRTDYGVTDATIEPGGNHPKCRFTYGGTERVLTLNVNGTGNFAGAFNLKRQDVRRLLGEPVAQPVKLKRTLEEMMPILEARKLESPIARESERYDLKASFYVYKDEKRLRFFLPPELLKIFPVGVGVEVSRIDASTWQLLPDPHRARPRVSDKRDFQVLGHELIVGLEPFVSSPAHGVMIDGIFLVDVPVETRRPPPRPTARPLPEREAVASRPPAESTAGHAPDEAYLRNALAAVRRVEAETAYRLVKSKETGAWMFVARIE